MKSGKIRLLSLLLVFAAGCGGHGSSPPPAALVAIVVTPANPSVAVGTTEQFTATGTFSDNSVKNVTSSVSWGSSDSSIATISNAPGLNGSASLITKGTTTITAVSGSVSGSATLTVTTRALVSVDVEPAVWSIPTGSSEQFTATGSFSDGLTTDITSSVTWISSDPTVATITGSGLATALSTATTATTMIMARSGNAPGSAILTVTGGPTAPAGNVLPITVNGSLCSPGTSAGYLNKPCTSVTVCTPGSSVCQTINDILLDTGSFGLRIFKSALGSSVSLAPVMSGSRPVAECAQFGDGSSEWGPVQTGDVILGNEKAKNVPIEIIDATFATVPGACPPPDADPAAAGFNGILGVGVFIQDCGPDCADFTNNGLYYSCAGSASGSACSPAAVPLSNQVQNPVWLLSANFNNGVIVELPSIPSAGSPSVDGILVLGIGANGVPSGVTAYNTDGFGEITTNFNGTHAGIIDSGSNGLYFPPPSAGVLPGCPSPNSVWFCPVSTTTFLAINQGASGSPSGDVYFQIANFESLVYSSNNAFSDLGGSMMGLFDWGLPFYFGRNIYVGIEGKVSGIGTGPYIAY